MSTKKLTTHQKDLIIDEVIGRTNPITIADLCKQTEIIEPEITEADIRKRIDYDVNKMDRAIMLGADLVSFKLGRDRMAKRRLKKT